MNLIRYRAEQARRRLHCGYRSWERQAADWKNAPAWMKRVQCARKRGAVLILLSALLVIVMGIVLFIFIIIDATIKP